MEKSGSRASPTKLIIEDSELQSPSQRVIYGTLTLLFWAIWIYMWLPLLTIGAWAFGVQRFVDIMIVKEGLTKLANVLTIYLIIIAIMGGALVIWATYNRFRFAGRERRTTQRPLERSSALLAKAFARRESTALIWQHKKTVRVSHHPDGRMAFIETGDDGATGDVPVYGRPADVEALLRQMNARAKD